MKVKLPKPHTRKDKISGGREKKFSGGREKISPDGSMALSDHLRELRNRIIICLVVLIAAFLLGMRYSREMVQLLLALGEQHQYHFVYIAPQELLLVYLAVDFVFAVCITLPVLFYEIWAFLRPGLNKNERLLYLLAMIFGTFFACLGIAFAYKILLPFMLYFLISLSAGSGIQSAVSVQSYISFLTTIFIIFAVIFELPVVTVLLTQLNILKVTWMKRFRKVMIVVIFFIAAVVTPPDVFSQIMVAFPLIALYELSIFLCTLAARIHPPRTDDTNDTDDTEDEISTH